EAVHRRPKIHVVAGELPYAPIIQPLYAYPNIIGPSFRDIDGESQRVTYRVALHDHALAAAGIRIAEDSFHIGRIDERQRFRLVGDCARAGTVDFELINTCGAVGGLSRRGDVQPDEAR